MNEDEMILDIANVLGRCCNEFDDNGAHIRNLCGGCEFWDDDNSCCCSYNRKEATALYNANYRKVADDEIVVKKSEYEELKTHIEDLQTKLGAVMLCIKNTHEIDISDLLRKQEQKTAKDILLEVAHALTKGNLNEIELAFIGIRYGIKLKENL